MKATWLLVGCVGCSGGMDFSLEVPAAVETVDAGGAIDAGRDAQATPDAQMDAQVDAPLMPDAPRAEVVTLDAGVEASADAADAGDAADVEVDAPDAAPDAPTEEAPPPICTPIALHVYPCGSAQTFTTPLQWYTTFSNGKCAFAPIPKACQCAETYTCECLLKSIDTATICPRGQPTPFCVGPDTSTTPSPGIGFACQ